MTKAVLITGASRGIGRATAILAGRRGWRVAVNYRGNSDAAGQTVRAVEQAGGQATCIQADVGREDDVMRMFDAATAFLGPIDGMVNNAGIVAPAMPLTEMTTQRLEEMMRVNVLGSYLCAREAARRMSTRAGGHGGSIVNVSSLAARTGSPGECVDYAGAKAAMDTMTVGLAKEMGPFRVRVNAVRPAFIDTEIHAVLGNPQRAHLLGRETPLGRAGTPEEVGEAIVWLLSDAASYVSGSLIDVAGGR
jgi:NAD(P)-dependent dehydrogenase (short-subunit alcohol dehydrogenase family)